MSTPVTYGAEIQIEPLDRPEGWVTVSVTPGNRYSYRAGVRGMFERTDDKGIAAFIEKAVPTILNMDRLNNEADAIENAAADAAESAS
jgi:hypothetical protein